MIGEGLASTASSNSLIYRLDPRVKVVVVFLFSVVVAVSNQFVVLVCALGLGLWPVLLARVPIGQLGRRLVPVNAFILFLCLFLPFTLQG